MSEEEEKKVVTGRIVIEICEDNLPNVFFEKVSKKEIDSRDISRAKRGLQRSWRLYKKETFLAEEERRKKVLEVKAKIEEKKEVSKTSSKGNKVVNVPED